MKRPETEPQPKPQAERYARISAIVGDARGLCGSELEAHLERACGDDDALRAEVDELLALAGDDDDTAAFAESDLEGARHALESVLDEATPAWLPEKIGDYTIVRLLGQGGMGVVYEAEQAAPQRRVALKLLHPMHATPERLRRFRREAALLGRLQHPGIAQIFEASTYDAGRGPQPFFAMELVDGVDICTHCEREGLDRAARIGLLARVADAVQYAHEHGVIHRDLKPDNVLVDSKGNPRILDFGIARASSSSATLYAEQPTTEGERWSYAPGVDGWATGLSVHPTRPLAAVVQQVSYGVTRTGFLRVIDTRTGDPVAEPKLTYTPWCAAYSPDGSTLAIGTNEGRVLLFETETYTQQLEWVAHDSYVFSLAFTPDGTRLVTASGDETLRTWDTRTRIASRLERERWTALRAELAARDDLRAAYDDLEGEQREAARAELIRRARAR